MTVEIGRLMHWHKIVSSYGHVSIIPVTVKKIGKRITIEVPQKDGGTRTTSVSIDRLREPQVK